LTEFDYILPAIDGAIDRQNQHDLLQEANVSLLNAPRKN
jgi:hypothetical protein